MANNTQNEVDAIIQFIEETENDKSITNIIVAAVLAFFNQRLKSHDHAFTEQASALQALQAADIQTAETFQTLGDYLVSSYAKLDITGLHAVLESRILPLESMGSEFDDIDGGTFGYTPVPGDWYYDNKDSYQIWQKMSEGKTGYSAKSGVIYINKHTGRLYEWNGSTMVEMWNEYRDYVRKIGISNMNQTDVSQIPVGKTHFVTSGASNNKLVYRVTASKTVAWTPRTELIYVDLTTHILYRKFEIKVDVFWRSFFHWNTEKI